MREESDVNMASNRMCPISRLLAPWCLGLSLLAAGCAPTRPAVDAQTLERRSLEYDAMTEESARQMMHRLLRRIRQELEDYQEGRVTEPPVVDVLVLSGGGDFGAFGVGFLRGWGSVSDPAWKRPTFDAVSGVSTGALIAPFAFVGDPDSYERAATLYTEPRPEWFRRRGPLFFLPSQKSFVRVDGLKRDIERELSEAFVRRIAEEAETGRVLGVLGTNLDLGRRRSWDLAYEARKAGPDKSIDRLVSILLASSAIPGAFPAVEIDDFLYADGALTSNILYEESMRSSNGLTSMWAAQNPGVPMPLTRYWVVINGQLDPIPQVTQPTWINVVLSGLGTAGRSATQTSLQNLAAQLELINKSGIGTKELHVISIPGNWRPPTAGRFQRETMQALAELGTKLGADPSSWHTLVRPETGASTDILPGPNAETP